MKKEIINEFKGYDFFSSESFDNQNYYIEGINIQKLESSMNCTLFVSFEIYLILSMNQTNEIENLLNQLVEY